MKEFLTRFFFVIVEVEVALLNILGRMIKFVFQTFISGKYTQRGVVRFVTMICSIVCMITLWNRNGGEHSMPKETPIKTEAKQSVKSIKWWEDEKPAIPIAPSVEDGKLETKPYVQPKVVESFPIRVYVLNRSMTNVVSSFRTSKGSAADKVVAPGKTPTIINILMRGNDEVSISIKRAGDKRPPIYYKIGRWPKVAYVYLEDGKLLKTTPEKVPEIMVAIQAQNKITVASVKGITVAEMYKDMERKADRK